MPKMVIKRIRNKNFYSNNKVGHHHDSILVENANVWGVLKVSWFFWWRPNQSGPLQKN